MVTAGEVVVRSKSVPSLHRSCLIVPGNSTRKLAKSVGLRPDEIVFDLEDAIPHSEKLVARERVVAHLLASESSDVAVGVRVNGLNSPWGLEDILGVFTGAPGVIDSIVLPKVSEPDHVRWLAITLDQLEFGRYLDTTVGIQVQIEDALGLSRINEIVSASSRVEAVTFGPVDFAASMGIDPDDPTAAGEGARAVLDKVRLDILLGARAAGVRAIDGPHTVIGDLEGLRLSTETSRAQGFDGRWLLHPDHIDIVNQSYAPTASSYERSVRLLDSATLDGPDGAVMYAGGMVDLATRKLAERIVASAEAAQRATSHDL
jgi:citrate lyase subunit beta/citryl-CoA lyase